MNASRPKPNATPIVDGITERLRHAVESVPEAGGEKTGIDGPASPPGPRPVPILGNAIRYVRQDPFRFLPDVATEYGPVVRWEFLGRVIYQLNDPKDIEHVLVHNNQNYTKGVVFQRSLAVTGNGLLNADGAVWHRQRHLLQPSFTPDRISEYGGFMIDRTEQMLEQWEEGETSDVYTEMRRLTLDIVASTLLGLDVRDRLDTIGRELDRVVTRSESTTASYLPPWAPLPVNRRADRAVRALDELVYSSIAARRDEPRSDVVSTLVSAADSRENEVTDREIRDQVMTLLLAGHETTALAITYTLLSVAQHPHVEETLLAELDRVCHERPLRPADVRNLSYAGRVFTESLRLHPPVYGIVREATVDDELGGYHVPTGTTVLMYQWLLHRDPRFYPNPMVFAPDRWTPEFVSRLPRFAYFPFGGGPRGCIGSQFARMEALLIMSTILRRYHLELASSPSVRSGAHDATQRPHLDARSPS